MKLKYKFCFCNIANFRIEPITPVESKEGEGKTSWRDREFKEFRPGDVCHAKLNAEVQIYFLI